MQLPKGRGLTNHSGDSKLGVGGWDGGWQWVPVPGSMWVWSRLLCSFGPQVTFHALGQRVRHPRLSKRAWLRGPHRYQGSHMLKSHTKWQLMAMQPRCTPLSITQRVNKVAHCQAWPPEFGSESHVVGENQFPKLSADSTHIPFNPQNG